MLHWINILMPILGVLVFFLLVLKVPGRGFGTHTGSVGTTMMRTAGVKTVAGLKTGGRQLKKLPTLLGKLLGDLLWFPIGFLPLLLLRQIFGPVGPLALVPNVQTIPWLHILSLPSSSAAGMWSVAIAIIWLVLMRVKFPDFYKNKIGILSGLTPFRLALVLGAFGLVLTNLPYLEAWMPYIHNTVMSRSPVTIKWPRDTRTGELEPRPNTMTKTVVFAPGQKALIDVPGYWAITPTVKNKNLKQHTCLYFYANGGMGHQYVGTGVPCPAVPDGVEPNEVIVTEEVYVIYNPTLHTQVLHFRYLPPR